jgi:hypothetical protein
VAIWTRRYPANPDFVKDVPITVFDASLRGDTGAPANIIAREKRICAR